MADTRAPGAAPHPSGATPEGVVGQATEAVRHVAESASELAQDTYERGARYVRDGLDRYPEAGRSISEGAQAVSRPVEQYPLTAIVIAGAVGYLLAYLIHGSGSRWGREESRITPERETTTAALGECPYSSLGLSQRCMFRPVLKVGTTVSDTKTAPPLYGLRPVYASRLLTANTPKSRSSKPGPLEVPYTAFRAEGPGSVGYPQRCNPKRIRDDRHRRGLVQDSDWPSLSRARPHRIDMLSQEHTADAKPVVDRDTCCDAVHLTPEIHIHQHQVRAVLACCEDGLLPRSHRSDEHVPKRMEKVGEAERHNRVRFSDEDAKRQWGRGRPHGFL